MREEKKRFVFTESVENFIRLRIKLRYDGISRNFLFLELFRGYMNDEPEIISFIDRKRIEKNVKMTKSYVRKKEKQLENMKKNEILFGLSSTETMFDVDPKTLKKDLEVGSEK